MPAAINQAPGNCQCDGEDECRICVTVTNCAGTLAINGATVTVTQDGDTVGTCETDIDGTCCVVVPEAGTYNVAVTKTGLIGSNQEVTATCPGDTATTLTAASGATYHKFTVGSSCVAASKLAGVAFTINGGTYTSDANGEVKFSAPAGTYTYTATKSRYADRSASVTLACSGTWWSWSMLPATGYRCVANGVCVTPAPETMTFTDSVHGSFTVTWVSFGLWTVTESISFPGGCGCDAATTNVSYGLNAGVIVISYTTSTDPDLCPGTGGVSSCGAIGGNPQTIDCGAPFAAEWSSDPCNCTGTSCSGTGNNCGKFWPDGATFTITE